MNSDQIRQRIQIKLHLTYAVLWKTIFRKASAELEFRFIYLPPIQEEGCFVLGEISNNTDMRPFPDDIPRGPAPSLFSLVLLLLVHNNYHVRYCLHALHFPLSCRPMIKTKVHWQ